MVFVHPPTFNLCRGAAMVKRIFLITTLFFLAPALVHAQADLTGFWVLRVPTGDGNFRETFFDLKQTGETVTGKVILGSRNLPISDGSFKDGKLHFVVNLPSRGQQRQIAYDGSMEGDKISLGVRFPGR